MPQDICSRYSTVSTLAQHYIFCPYAQKDVHLVSLINDQSGSSILVFTRTVQDSSRLSILLRLLGFSAIPLHGQLSQSARLGALNKFKGGGRSILIATDVASRGLDIPAVDLVVNYDMPTNSKDYIHRVGRTARAGRSGRSVTIVSQYDVELLQRIEGVINLKLSEFPSFNKDAVGLLEERVGQAAREAIREMRETGGQKGAGGAGKRKRRAAEAAAGIRDDDMDRDDDLVEASMPRNHKIDQQAKKRSRR